MYTYDGYPHPAIGRYPNERRERLEDLGIKFQGVFYSYINGAIRMWLENCRDTGIVSVLGCTYTSIWRIENKILMSRSLLEQALKA